jgi:uncharacterized RDD family membrane protein YckC
MTDPGTPPLLARMEQTLNRLLDPRRTMIFRPARYTGIYGTFNDRMLAALIDLTWMMFLLGPVLLKLRPYIYGADDPQALLSHADGMQDLWQALLTHGYTEKLAAEYMLSYLLLCPILALMWSYTSTTPGKWLLRLRIVDAATLGRVSWRQVVWRLAGYVVAILPLGLGILWMGVDRRKRGWHDYFAGTAVVRVKHWRIRDDGSQPHILPENQPSEPPAAVPDAPNP